MRSTRCNQYMLKKKHLTSCYHHGVPWVKWVLTIELFKTEPLSCPLSLKMTGSSRLCGHKGCSNQTARSETVAKLWRGLAAMSTKVDWAKAQGQVCSNMRPNAQQNLWISPWHYKAFLCIPIVSMSSPNFIHVAIISSWEWSLGGTSFELEGRGKYYKLLNWGEVNGLALTVYSALQCHIYSFR